MIFLPYEMVDKILSYDGRFRYDISTTTFVGILHKDDCRYDIIRAIYNNQTYYTVNENKKMTSRETENTIINVWYNKSYPEYFRRDLVLYNHFDNIQYMNYYEKHYDDFIDVCSIHTNGTTQQFTITISLPSPPPPPPDEYNK